MLVSCLVCGKPTTTTHMGMDVCRACTVFYQRHRGARDRLQCFSECGDRPCIDRQKGVFACRKCRLDRFEAVMRAGEEPAHQSVDGSAGEAFGRMMQQLIFRREGELSLRGIFLNNNDTIEENYEIIPCTYRCMNEGTRILVAGLFDFASAVFPDFQKLPSDDKWLLIRNYQQIFHCIDGELRALQRFGQESFFTFGSYTTFLSGEFAEKYFIDCPDQSNLATAANTLRECIDENVPAVQKQIYQIDPSEEEFLAMIGLALWSVENVEPDDQLLAIASRNRNQILAELTAHYGRTISNEQGTARLGVVLCLLQEFRRVDLNLKSEYEIYRILNVFDDDTFMYRLQAHRAPEVS
ncbi:hypothetical protein PRIPAC_81819 [Pristionchus pacificus]|uniref:Nuclear receptor n=1 Tax=Pristionchus pacificus TaxID=54126 RepID=A0A2A6CQE2_PRIPA|nr:hypothetical protein PRIPAC_81819 [Pristionchus pacificus]|eukprot:PDM80277.1 nuclear receptor [Pristionchus pacificus]